MAPQITYRSLSPGTEPTTDELTRAEMVGVRRVDAAEEAPSHAVGDVIRAADERHGGKERNFRVVSVGNPTHSIFVEDPSSSIDNLNVFVTDAG